MVSVDKIGTTGYIIVTLKSELEVFESLKNAKPLQCEFFDGEEDWAQLLKEPIYVRRCITRGEKDVFDFFTLGDIKRISLCSHFAWRFYMDDGTPRAILHNVFNSSFEFL